MVVVVVVVVVAAVVVVLVVVVLVVVVGISRGEMSRCATARLTFSAPLGTRLLYIASGGIYMIYLERAVIGQLDMSSEPSMQRSRSYI
jgi:hypothetical protein